MLIADVAGRVYVWNALEKNPTLSPIGTYAIKKASDGSVQDIVPSESVSRKVGSVSSDEDGVEDNDSAAAE